MNKKFALSILITLIFIPLALAASSAMPSTGINLFDQVLGPFGNMNVAESYFKYAAFIDAILYFVLFIGLAQAALGEKFKDNKTIPIVLGIMLAIGMCIFELKTGWNLSLLSGYAALIFFGLLIAGPYMLMKKWGAESFYAFCIAYLVTFSILNGTGLLLNSEFTKTLGQNSMIWNLIWILYAVSIIGAIAGIIRLFKRKGNGELGMSNAKKSLNGYTTNANDTLKKQQDAENKYLKLDSQMKAVENQLTNIDSIMNEFKDKDLKSRANQLQLIEALEKTLIGTQQLQAYVRQMSSRAGQAEFVKFTPQVHEAVVKLSQFINTLQQLIMRLNQEMQQTADIDTKELEIDKNLPTYIDKLITENSQLLDLEKEFGYIDKIDTTLYAQIRQEYDKLKKKIADQTNYADNLKKDLDSNIFGSIKQIDSDNNIILTDMMRMLDNSKLTKIRFKWFADVFETAFIDDQSLAKVSQYIPTLKRNLNLIINIKERFRNAFQSKNDVIKNKFLALQNEIVNDFKKTVDTITDLTFKKLANNQKQFLDYSSQIQIIIKEVTDSNGQIGDSPNKFIALLQKLEKDYINDKTNMAYKALLIYLSDSIPKILNDKSNKDTKDPSKLNTAGLNKLKQILTDLENTLNKMRTIQEVDKKVVAQAQVISKGTGPIPTVRLP